MIEGKAEATRSHTVSEMQKKPLSSCPKGDISDRTWSDLGQTESLHPTTLNTWFIILQTQMHLQQKEWFVAFHIELDV